MLDEYTVRRMLCDMFAVRVKGYRRMLVRPFAGCTAWAGSSRGVRTATLPASATIGLFAAGADQFAAAAIAVCALVAWSAVYVR